MSEEVIIPGETVVQLVQHWGLSSNNDQAAFISLDENKVKRSISRKEVLDLAKRFAHQLREHGVRKGSIVCNALPNSLERVVCEFGIHFSGATSMNGQIFRSDGEDFFDSLRTSQCSLVIVDPGVPQGARQLLLKEVPIGCELSVKSHQLPYLRHLLVCARDDSNSEADFITSLRDSHLPEFTAEVFPDDLATVMTTSGSTGYSKLVKLTHRSICHFCKQVKAIEPLSSSDRMINCSPLGWAGGYPQWYLSCGVTRYFLDMHDGQPKNLPLTIWTTIVEEKIVYGFLSPMYVSQILENPSYWQGSKWKPKVLCLAGQAVKKEQMDIIGKLCEAVDINYGTTEGNVLTTQRITDPSTYVDSCAGSVGYEVKLRIVDQDRNDVPHGTTGELLFWSPALCSGYLNNDPATQSSFTSDGWFCTNDAGYMSDDGKFYVKGRQSDCISRGVYILYPGWLEKKLCEFPGVTDVVLVAVPDKVLSNEICACVVTAGVNGVVVGSLHEETENDVTCSTEVSRPPDIPRFQDSCDVETDDDLVDNASTDYYFCKDHKSREIVIDSNGVNEHTTKMFVRSNCELDRIRSSGVRKPLTTKFFETKVQSDTILRNKHERRDQSRLQLFERDIRKYADSIELLSEKDAMHMVPKYYIFMDKFPRTSTGKVNRKDLRTMAASLLGLD